MVHGHAVARSVPDVPPSHGRKVIRALDFRHKTKFEIEIDGGNPRCFGHQVSSKYGSTPEAGCKRRSTAAARPFPCMAGTRATNEPSIRFPSVIVIKPGGSRPDGLPGSIAEKAIGGPGGPHRYGQIPAQKAPAYAVILVGLLLNLHPGLHRRIEYSVEKEGKANCGFAPDARESY